VKGTLISWNIPNMITVPAMAFLAFLLVAVIWQLVVKAMPSNAGNNAGGGGY
jgi:hypothetical protein